MLLAGSGSVPVSVTFFISVTKRLKPGRVDFDLGFGGTVRQGGEGMAARIWAQPTVKEHSVGP